MFQFGRKTSSAPVKLGVPAGARVGLARTVIGVSVTACLSVVWAHALAVPLRHFASASAERWAWPLTLAALGVSAVAGIGSRARPHYPAAAGCAVVTWALVAVLVPGSAAPTLALLPVALLSAFLSPAIAKRLPASLDALPRTHRVRAGLWLLVALVAVTQLARLSTWMSDPSSDWFLTTRHPFWAKHECLSAYVYGGELALRGEDNVYDATHYPGLNREAEPQSEVAEMTVEDPFEYAPQFLLWPAAALALTHDYPSIRAVWFALQTTLFFAVVGWLGIWVGGRAGRVSLLLWPLALSAFPALHALQYGQFHLAAIVLSVAAMLAFDTERNRLGGAMLSVAVLSKIFPGILLVVLLARRQWRALGWTAGFGTLLTAVSLAVLGPAPFWAFFEYHLPRLQSGAAFAFGEAWPEMREIVIAANHGVYGLVMKLGEMGLPGADSSMASWINRLFLFGLVAVAWRVGRQGSLDRERRAVAWLSLLGLGSMASTGAFVDYVPLTATWLLTLVAWRLPNVARIPRVQGLAMAATVLVVWVFQYTLFGTVPIGEYFDPGVMLPLSSLSLVMMLGLFGASLYRVVQEPVHGMAEAPHRYRLFEPRPRGT
jgi:hypothetical protein